MAKAFRPFVGALMSVSEYLGSEYAEVGDV